MPDPAHQTIVHLNTLNTAAKETMAKQAAGTVLKTQTKAQKNAIVIVIAVKRAVVECWLLYLLQGEMKQT